MGIQDKLINSANLYLLYISFILATALKVSLPLSLIFAMIATKNYLIKNRQIINIYALGYSKVQVLKPFLYFASFAVLIYILLHTTPFAYAEKYVMSLKTYKSLNVSTKDLFFKYKDNYIYMQYLHPIQKKAENIIIFNYENQKLKSIIRAQQALFKDNFWTLENNSIMHNIQGEQLSFKDDESLKVLKDFKPKILDNIYESQKYFTLGDLILTIGILHEQGINIKPFVSILIAMILMPFLPLFLITIIFFMIPLQKDNLRTIIFSFITTSIVWGTSFTLITLAINSVLSIYVFLSFFTLCFAFSVYTVIKNT